eukprot:1023265-Rhodomonas_salina.1
MSGSELSDLRLAAEHLRCLSLLCVTHQTRPHQPRLRVPRVLYSSIPFLPSFLPHQASSSSAPAPAPAPPAPRSLWPRTLFAAATREARG